MGFSMDRWKGKVAIVTGASSGIGHALAKRLVEEGLQVIGLARRVELIEELANDLKDQEGKLYPFHCDVTIEKELVTIFQWAKKNLGPVHIMINNAGVLLKTNLIDGDVEIWRQVFETNVIGLCVGTREAVRDMIANKVDGHIIHINSIGGHVIPYFYTSNVYPASKHAVTALTETLRKELHQNKLNIKITSVSPGVVQTDIFKKCDEHLGELVALKPSLTCEDVVDSVIYALSTRPNVQVHELIIKPLHEEY